MKILMRIIQQSVIGGAWQFFRLFWRGVRFHPWSRVIGASGRVVFGKGAKIGPRCLFDVSSHGRIKVGDRAWFYKDVEIRSDGLVDIGAESTFQKGVTINGDVSIGRGCIFAPNVFVSSGAHIYNYAPEMPIRKQDRLYREHVGRYSKRVEIGDDCWLGINVVVMPGVRVGQGVVIGANSVVTKDVPDLVVVAGAPARIIKRRNEKTASENDERS